MSTINQKRKKIVISNYISSPNLKKNPQVRGRFLKMLIVTPRKPNSALRKIGRVLLVNKKRIFTKIPGSGAIPQKFATVLVRGKGHKDTPSVKYSLIRGVYECLPLFQKKRKRSLYGTPNSYKIHIKRILRRIMGSIGIISAFICISIFSIILY
jgi:small subunit ribosomal protein S12